MRSPGAFSFLVHKQLPISLLHRVTTRVWKGERKPSEPSELLQDICTSDTVVEIFHGKRRNCDHNVADVVMIDQGRLSGFCELLALGKASRLSVRQLVFNSCHFTDFFSFLVHNEQLSIPLLHTGLPLLIFYYGGFEREIENLCA